MFFFFCCRSVVDYSERKAQRNFSPSSKKKRLFHFATNNCVYTHGSFCPETAHFSLFTKFASASLYKKRFFPVHAPKRTTKRTVKRMASMFSNVLGYLCPVKGADQPTTTPAGHRDPAVLRGDENADNEGDLAYGIEDVQDDWQIVRRMSDASTSGEEDVDQLDCGLDEDDDGAGEALFALDEDGKLCLLIHLFISNRKKLMHAPTVKPFTAFFRFGSFYYEFLCLIVWLSDTFHRLINQSINHK